jgi:hypothetical protein
MRVLVPLLEFNQIAPAELSTAAAGLGADHLGD